MSLAALPVATIFALFWLLCLGIGLAMPIYGRLTDTIGSFYLYAFFLAAAVQIMCRTPAKTPRNISDSQKNAAS